MYSVFTVPDTGRDSHVMQGEVDGCISLTLPAINLEQSVLLRYASTHDIDRSLS